MKRGELVALDTNVLVYADDPSHPNHRRAREVLEKVLTGSLRACLTQQVLAEYYAVVTGGHRIEKPLSAMGAKERVVLLSRSRRIKKIYPKRFTFRRCIDFCAKEDIRGARVFDAIYAFTLLENGVGKLITQNAKDFGPFKGELEIIPLTS